MDQLILAARDVVDAWENHTVELEVVIARLAEALRAFGLESELDAEQLRPAAVA
jgi:hypothetical protein